MPNNAPAVLVVDDEHFIAMMIQDALADAGYAVVTVSNAREAVSAIKAGGNAAPCRALVTDINGLGDMDGWAIARAGREIDPTLPVVYVTGAAAAEWAAHGVPNSVLVPKPFAPAQIVTAVSQLLNTSAPVARD
jgi:DNA-binding response OmpR family regulator